MASLRIDLPDPLHRSLKVEAASRGMPLKDLVQGLLTDEMLDLGYDEAIEEGEDDES